MDQLGDSNLSSGSPVLGIENRIGQAPMDYNLLPGTSKFIPQEPQSSDLIPQFPEGVMEMPEIAALSQPGNEPLYSEAIYHSAFLLMFCKALHFSICAASIVFFLYQNSPHV